jgi:hypothetical protein
MFYRWCKWHSKVYSLYLQVVTLLKPDCREFGQPRPDVQLHVLPNYRTAGVDESGSTEAQLTKVQSGAVQVLHE